MEPSDPTTSTVREQRAVLVHAQGAEGTTSTLADLNHLLAEGWRVLHVSAPTRASERWAAPETWLVVVGR